MRALESIAQAGTLGGIIRCQDHGEQSRKADAQNAINQFNANAKNSAQEQKNTYLQTVYSNKADATANKANIKTGQSAMATDRANQHSAEAANSNGTGIGIFEKLLSGVK